MKKTLFFISLFSATAFAQDPPYIYQLFGYTPPNFDEKALSQSQQDELDGCTNFAKERDEVSRKDLKKMARIYGPQALQYDFFGIYLTGCLADEKSGKGWSVQEKRGELWEKVRSRFATRTFMKLDPTQ